MTVDDFSIWVGNNKIIMKINRRDTENTEQNFVMFLQVSALNSERFVAIYCAMRGKTGTSTGLISVAVMLRMA